MKLSEAILLGSTMHKQIFGAAYDGSGGRCALGAAAAAIGVSYFAIDPIWPWQDTNLASCPECGDAYYEGTPLYVGNVIAMHLNDRHRWSLERIAAWVASIEPQEEATDGGQGPVVASLEEVKA